MSSFTKATASTGEDAWKPLAAVYMNLTKGPTVRPITSMLAMANERWPFESARGILDNGCGPGPVIQTLFDQYGDKIQGSTALRAADFSPAMVEQLEKLKQYRVEAGDAASALFERLETGVEDAQTLEGVEDESLSHVLAGMMYMLVPNPMKALEATHRVLVPSGVVSLSCWKRSDWMDIMALAFENNPHPGLPAEWVSTDGVVKELEKAGFRNVSAVEVPTTMDFTNHEDIIEFFLTKMPPLIERTKGMSSMEIAVLKRRMVQGLEAMHPTAPGTINGTAIVAVAQK